MCWLTEAFLIAVVALAAGMGVSADETANPDALRLPDDFYPIMPWQTITAKSPAKGYAHPLESVAECNFTIAGFVGPEDLPVCERLGLKAIISAPPGNAAWKSKWKGLGDEAISGAVKDRIRESGASSSILGYYIVDEPGTSHFPALATAVETVKQEAPGKLAYINLFPGYATLGAPDQSQLGAASYTAYLEKFIADVKPQFLSYDDYKIVYSDNMQSKRHSEVYFRDLLEVRDVARKHGLPFWNIACSNRIRPYTTIPSPANMLLQAYTTLAAGGRGLSWYTYYDGGYAYAPMDSNGLRSETWSYLQMVNGQVKVLGPIMNRLVSTGVFFSSPAPAPDVPLLPGRIVESVVSRASIERFTDEKPPLMFGEFEDGSGTDYVMVVNLSLEKSANFLLHTRSEYAVKATVSSRDGSAKALDEKNGHWLVPGQGVLIRLGEEKKD